MRRTTAVSIAVLLTVAAFPTTRAAATPRAARTAAAVKARTVWLCRPGAAVDPCAVDEAATSVSASGVSTPQAAPAVPTTPAFDCFYVYGTVSAESTVNADLRIQKEETDVAVEQASRFSSVCRVWAPIYRQVTVAGLEDGEISSPKPLTVASDSLISAWDDYLARDNHGRPVVFIGHSQGAAMIIDLLERHVDDVPALRRRMVSAIIAGGNVVVPDGRQVGGTFRHLPTCTTPAQTGCVIAWSSFSSPPPADSLFGVPGQGVSLLSGQTRSAGVHVVCVNPGLIGSSAAEPLSPYFAGTTPATAAAPAGWATYPGLYTATCDSRGDATWLQVDTTHVAGDTRPVVTPTLGPTWGLHIDDMNLPLGNLVTDVAQEEAAYTAARG